MTFIIQCYKKVKREKMSFREIIFSLFCYAFMMTTKLVWYVLMHSNDLYHYLERIFSIS